MTKSASINREIRDLRNAAGELIGFLKLRTSPVGFKVLKKPGDLEKITELARPPFQQLLCQIVGNVRRHKKRYGATVDDMFCHHGGACAGIMDQPLSQTKGTWFMELGMTRDPKQAEAIGRDVPHIEHIYEAIALAPLEEVTFVPDLAIVYANTHQISRLVIATCSALNLTRLHTTLLGDTGLCGDGIGQAFSSGQPKLFVPCIGDQAHGGALSEELGLVVQANSVPAIVGSLMKLVCPEPLTSTLAAVGSNREVVEIFEEAVCDRGKGLKTKKTPLI